jgi:hypothetical protein
MQESEKALNMLLCAACMCCSGQLPAEALCSGTGVGLSSAGVTCCTAIRGCRSFDSLASNSSSSRHLQFRDGGCKCCYIVCHVFRGVWKCIARTPSSWVGESCPAVLELHGALTVQQTNCLLQFIQLQCHRLHRQRPLHKIPLQWQRCSAIVLQQPPCALS